MLQNRQQITQRCKEKLLKWYKLKTTCTMCTTAQFYAFSNQWQNRRKSLNLSCFWINEDDLNPNNKLYCHVCEEELPLELLCSGLGSVFFIKSKIFLTDSTSKAIPMFSSSWHQFDCQSNIGVVQFFFFICLFPMLCTPNIAQDFSFHPTKKIWN